jgi:hypothetical protein
MPQELSITFSLGQGPAADDKQGTTPVSASDVPIYEFDAKPRFGASQNSPSEGTLSLSPTPLNPESISNGRSPIVPSGVTFRPRLRLAVPGSAPKLKTRQLWEGTVTEVRNGGFAAVLRDRTKLGNPDEQASFDFDYTEISPEDLQFINPGSSFYWVIGNELTAGGQVKNVSMLQFRRVPAWTQRRLDRVTERARRLRASFQE